MQITKSNKQFIPRDKPKSWIIFICSGLVCLLVASPIAIGGSVLKIKFLQMTGIFLFDLCWSTMAVMFVVGIINRIIGRWKNIEEKDWKDQVW